MKTEKNLLNICARLIERKLGWGEGKNWVNSQYEALNQEILKATNVNISVSTLKRVFGKHATDENYSPQKATKEALVNFLGYANWYEFKKAHIRKKSPKSKLVIPKILFPSLLVAFISLAFIFFLFPEKGNHSFTPRNLEGENFHTIHIDYKITGRHSYKIDFGDGSIIPLDPEKNTIARYFQVPGVYYGKIFKDNEIIQRFNTTIHSNGWQAYLYTPGNKRYYPVSHIAKHPKSGMNISDSLISSQPIDTSKSYWTFFCKSFNLPSNTLDFKTVLKNPSDLFDVQCNHVVTELFFETGKVQLYFVKEGCSRWVKLQFADEIVEGGFNDLSAFGDDFSQWRTVSLKVDKNYTVYLDENRIYSQEKTKSFGALKALRISFSGSGNIQSMAVNDYTEVFE